MFWKFFKNKLSTEPTKAPVDPEAIDVSPALEAAVACNQTSRQDAALRILRDALEQAPNHPDLLLAYWDQSVRMGLAAEAVETGLALIDYRLANGQFDQAMFHWREWIPYTPSQGLDLEHQLQMANALLDAGMLRDAAAVLHHLFKQNIDTSSDLAARLATSAGIVSPELGLEAFDILKDRLNTDDLSYLEGKCRNWRQNLDNSPHGHNPEAIPVVLEQVPVPTSATPFKPTRINKLLIARVIPSACNQERLTLETTDRSIKELPLTQVKAIAVGLIRDLSSKPFFLIDLLLDDPWTELPGHRILRIYSNSFNPFALIPSAKKPMEAFKSLISNILTGGHASPLPSRENVSGETYLTFSDEHAMETEVYGVSS